METTRDISSVRNPPVAPPAGAARDDARLREVCGEFAGVLLGVLLKEGLTGHALGGQDDQEAPGADMLLETAVEQTAREMGRSGAMGLSDMLYEQLTGGPPAAVPARGAGRLGAP